MRGRFERRAIAAAGVALASALGDGANAQTPPSKAPQVAITVVANGFRNTNGQAIVALYSKSDGWLKLDKADKVLRLKISGGSLQATLPDVAPGVYAVSVIHDENSNGKLDMHWLPIPGPDEGAGVSNDATATFGPPSFADARLQIGDKGGVVTLKIRY